MTPLELLNFYFSDGKSIGNKQSKLWRRFNERLTWDAILNKGYQSSLCPLLYYILTKWKPESRPKRFGDSNALDDPCAPTISSHLKAANDNNQPSDPDTFTNFKSINPMDHVNLINSGELSPSNPVIHDLRSISWPSDLITQLPNNIITELKSFYYVNLRRNMLLLDELSKVLKAFNEACIDVIVLKGAALAQTIYPDVALRPMGDIDLLIRKKDLNQAKRLLSEEGYDAYIPEHTKDFYEEIVFHIRYAKRQDSNNFIIELHWDISKKNYFYGMNIEEIWQDSSMNQISGTYFLSMSSDHLLLYLCWHSAKHFLARLIWLFEISEMLKRYGQNANWGSLIKMAEDTRMTMPFYYVLYLVREIVGAPTETKILTKVKPHSFKVGLFIRFVMSNINQSHIGNGVTLMAQDLFLMDGNLHRMKFFLKDSLHYLFPGLYRLMLRHSINTRKAACLFYPLCLVAAIYNVLKSLLQIMYYTACGKY